MVTSRHDYCNALYLGLLSESTQKLQLVQNVAVPMLTGASGFQHITPALQVLHVLPNDRHFLYLPSHALHSAGEATSMHCASQ